MSSNNIYCTYVTTYLGNKLPPFYIGSSSVERVNSGYRGSIKSKKWSGIFYNELKENPHLFFTEIIKTFDDKKSAVEYELQLQIANDVVKSKWFFNESLARDFGWHGMNNKGEANPVFGKRWKHNKEFGDKISLIQKQLWSDPEYKARMSNMRKGVYCRPNEKINKRNELILRIKNLYDTRPELSYNYISKNGIKLTYDRAFSNKFCKDFNLSNVGLYGIIKSNFKLSKIK